MFLKEPNLESEQAFRFAMGVGKNLLDTKPLTGFGSISNIWHLNGSAQFVEKSMRPTSLQSKTPACDAEKIIERSGCKPFPY